MVGRTREGAYWTLPKPRTPPQPLSLRDPCFPWGRNSVHALCRADSVLLSWFRLPRSHRKGDEISKFGGYHEEPDTPSRGHDAALVLRSPSGPRNRVIRVGAASPIPAAGWCPPPTSKPSARPGALLCRPRPTSPGTMFCRIWRRLLLFNGCLSIDCASGPSKLAIRGISLSES